MKRVSFARFVRIGRFIVLDLSWMVAYASMAAAVAGVGRAVWLIIDETLRRAQ